MPNWPSIRTWFLGWASLALYIRVLMIASGIVATGKRRTGTKNVIQGLLSAAVKFGLLPESNSQVTVCPSFAQGEKYPVSASFWGSHFAE